MANIQKDVLVRFTGEAAGVKRAAKEVEADLKRLTGQVAGIGKMMKAGLGLAVGQELKEFLKSTFAEATKAGSELNKALGGQGAQAAQELADAVQEIRTGIQLSVVSILSEFVPALQEAARWAKEIRERLGAGQQGEGRDVGEERRASRGKDASIGDQLSAAIGQQDRLQRERDRVNNGRGFGDFIDTITGVRGNRLAVLDAQLATVTTEVEAFKANLQAINKNNAAQTFAAIKNAGDRFAGILGDVGGGLFTGARALGQQGIGAIRGGIAGFQRSMQEEDASRARAIIEANRSPVDEMREELQELQRLRSRGALNPAQFETARMALADRARDMMPQLPRAGDVPDLAGEDRGFLTRGRAQPEATREERQILDSARRQEKLLQKVSELLSQINSGKIAVTIE